MCGLAGIFDPGQRWDPDRLERGVQAMTRRLAHRGPDAEHCVTGKGFALGHRRLAIVDPSPAGAQPMADGSGRYLCVFNGCVYNYRDIRRELVEAGVRFVGHSDTEVLVEAFARHGDAILDRIDGMYALAIVDTKTDTLTLARDRWGEKPLHYADRDGVVAFGSELKAIEVAPGFEPRVSRAAITAYLALRYVPAPYSIYDGVRKLMPGEVLRISRDGRERRRLTPVATQPYENLDEEEALDRLEALLTRSVRDRFEAADVPVGLFLSAGTDSTLIAALAARRLGSGFTAHTLEFDADEAGEAERAGAIAGHLGIEHNVIRVDRATARARTDRIGSSLDEPLADRSCLPVDLLCERVAGSVKVAVGGDGADELFLGYTRYRRLPRPVGDDGGEAEARVRAYLASCLPVVPIDTVGRAMAEGDPTATAILDDAIAGMAAPLGAAPGADGFAAVDRASYLPDAVLAKVDRMSMRSGLEVRTPYLAPEVSGAVDALFGALPLDDRIGKRPLRRLLDRYLPRALTDRPKSGFGVPASVFKADETYFADRFRHCYLALARARWLAPSPAANKRLFEAAAGNINGIWAIVVLHGWLAERGLVE